jgi:hypothetical protein
MVTRGVYDFHCFKQIYKLFCTVYNIKNALFLKFQAQNPKSQINPNLQTPISKICKNFVDMGLLISKKVKSQQQTEIVKNI